jgi:1,4-alpha-glucan branching enzyme
MRSSAACIQYLACLALIHACNAHMHMGAVRLADKPGYSFRVWVPHANGVKIELKDVASKTAAATFDLVRREENGNPNVWYAECDEAKLGDEYRVCVESSWNDCFAQEGAVLYRRDPYARYRQIHTVLIIGPGIILPPHDFAGLGHTNNAHGKKFMFFLLN